MDSKEEINDNIVMLFSCRDIIFNIQLFAHVFLALPGTIPLFFIEIADDSIRIANGEETPHGAGQSCPAILTYSSASTLPF